MMRGSLVILWILTLLSPLHGAWAQEHLSAGPSLQIPGAESEIKALANQLYKRCQKTPDPTLTPEGQEEYCVCLSAQMYRKSLKDEERRYLATGEGAPMDYKRSITEVYGQCIGIPGRAATYYACTHSPSAYKLVKTEQDLDAMCRCVLKEMSEFWDVVAPAFLAIEMIYRDNITDPLEYILKGREYPVHYSENRSKCVALHGRRD